MNTNKRPIGPCIVCDKHSMSLQEAFCDRCQESLGLYCEDDYKRHVAGVDLCPDCCERESREENDCF